MRVIKFRAYGPNSKYMWSWEELVANDISMRWMQPSFGEKILMQYTGLKDQNSKEIYEADIVKLRILGQVLHRQVIQDVSGSWCIAIPAMGSTEINGTLIQVASLDVEVIGNTYENKDLLQK